MTNYLNEINQLFGPQPSNLSFLPRSSNDHVTSQAPSVGCHIISLKKKFFCHWDKTLHTVPFGEFGDRNSNMTIIVNVNRINNG